MMSGLPTTGSTNFPTGGDPALHGTLHPGDAIERESVSRAAETTAPEPSRAPTVADSNIIDANSAAPNADSWRDEVAARLERYRTRRKPRGPRYPSLLLPFDAPESWSRPAPPATSVGTGSVALAIAPAHDFSFDVDSRSDDEATVVDPHSLVETDHASNPARNPHPYRDPEQLPEPTAKLIEFPRSAAIPVFHASELADPIFDRPRIVEAPEILPPPPALGGMLIEPAQQESADGRPESPFAFPSASIARRALASLVDGAVVATSVAAFAAIFIRLNPSLNPSLGPGLNAALNLSSGTLPVLAATLIAATVMFWMVYEFLFIVYTGSTPGLRAVRLELTRFDGSPLNRRLRRWRVLASFLSAFSAGLGYLWSALDQDALCWHDRITRTHVQSASPKK